MSKEKIQGGSLEWNADPFFRSATDEAEKAMKKSAIYLQGVVKKMVGGVGQGKQYKRGKKIHRASLPNSPPARDTGALASSISYRVKKNKLSIQGFVGPDINKIKSRQKTGTTDPNYGAYLELGAKKRGLKKRPFLKPSLKKAKPKIKGIFKKALGR